MIRATSIAAYNQVKASGYLSKKRWQTYQFLAEFGPMTAGEFTVNIMKANGRVEGNPSYHRRLEELEKQQVVRRIGTRTCSVSNKEAEVWDIIENPTPTPYVAVTKKAPSKKEMADALEELKPLYLRGLIGRTPMEVLAYFYRKTVK